MIQRRIGLEDGRSRRRLGEFWLKNSKRLFSLAAGRAVGLQGSQVPEHCEEDVPGKHIKVVSSELWCLPQKEEYYSNHQSYCQSKLHPISSLDSGALSLEEHHST